VWGFITIVRKNVHTRPDFTAVALFTGTFEVDVPTCASIHFILHVLMKAWPSA
jgi:hypothetical protein